MRHVQVAQSERVVTKRMAQDLHAMPPSLGLATCAAEKLLTWAPLLPRLDERETYEVGQVEPARHGPALSVGPGVRLDGAYAGGRQKGTVEILEVKKKETLRKPCVYLTRPVPVAIDSDLDGREGSFLDAAGVSG